MSIDVEVDREEEEEEEVSPPIIPINIPNLGNFCPISQSFT
jgi:hypothetical protein